jgi:hypothetical protein
MLPQILRGEQSSAVFAAPPRISSSSRRPVVPIYRATAAGQGRPVQPDRLVRGRSRTQAAGGQSKSRLRPPRAAAALAMNAPISIEKNV